MSYLMLLCCLLGSLVFLLSFMMLISFQIQTWFAEIEMKLLADILGLRTDIKEQIKGGIDFHIREFKTAVQRPVSKRVKLRKPSNHPNKT